MPAGIGVSIPPRGKSLPSSLQFKLGTKSMCMFYFFGLFHFFFFVEVLFSFIFCCGEVCSVSIGPSPPSILYLTYSTGRGLCFAFDLLLYSVVNVWRRVVSPHLRARPSPVLQRREAACRRTATTLASREPRYCLMGRY